MLLTSPPLTASNLKRSIKFVRLACLMCAASVYPEPGSNSLILVSIFLLFRVNINQVCFSSFNFLLLLVVYYYRWLFLILNLLFTFQCTFFVLVGTFCIILPFAFFVNTFFEFFQTFFKVFFRQNKISNFFLISFLVVFNY